MNTRGKLHATFEAKQVTERFRKREFVLELAENPRYPQFVQFQLTGDRCEKLDEFSIGARIKQELDRLRMIKFDRLVQRRILLNVYRIKVGLGFDQTVDDFVLTTSSGTVQGHGVAFGTDIGLESSQAAWILSLMAGGAAAAKIVFGWLANRIGEQSALFISIAMQGMGILALTFSMPFDALIVVALLVGLGFGGVMPLSAALLARSFGPQDFGPMMGLMTPLMIPFQALGAPFAAGVFDATGSYTGAWYAFAAIAILACGILSMLRLTATQESDLADPAGQQA